MSDIVYAVHTRSCTYLLDDEGICRWVLSRSGEPTDDRCVGAQFVAALDLHSRGGLVGELRIGASALFIRSEGGRFMLIRTKPIERVEARGAAAEPEEPYEAAAPEDPYQAAGYAPVPADPYQAAGYAPAAPYPIADYPTEPVPEPVALPSHHAVAGVFNAPLRAPEPMPPSEQRVIVQSSPPPYGDPYAMRPPTDPPPPMRMRTEPMPRAPERGHTEPPPPPAPPPMVTRPPLPIAPPRTPVPAPRARASRHDEAHATQPLPPVGSFFPTASSPAWPAMLAPPPPQAELLPLGPARPDFPSSEELDDADLEEVGDDEQVYSTEVTVSLPLFRPEPRQGPSWRR